MAKNNKDEEPLVENPADEIEGFLEQDEGVEAIKKFTSEDDDMGEISLKSILGGDILGSKLFLKQVAFVMFCVVLMLVYTGNRYGSQQDAICIDSLRNELQVVKYNVMSQSSELMNFTRQSNVEKMLRGTKDSVLQNPITPPYLITTDGHAEEPPAKEQVTDPENPTEDEV